MASFSTNEFKSGLKVLIDGDPCMIVENEFVKPGKGQAFNRVKIKNLKTGRVVEKTFKSGDSVEAADVIDLDMEYLYTDGEFYHFMMTDGSFEQHAADAKAVGDVAKWLKEQETYSITLFNGAPLAITPPNHIELEVVERLAEVDHAGELVIDARTAQQRKPHGGGNRGEHRHGHDHLANAAAP